MNMCDKVANLVTWPIWWPAPPTAVKASPSPVVWGGHE